MKRYDIKTTDTETLRKWYYLMSLGRALDEKAPSYLLQSLGWSYHAPYAGHDGIQLAIGQVFHRGEDYLFPYYRDMLTVLSAGMTAEEVILNGISKATDPSSGGRHMSNHFAKPEWHIENISSATGTHDLHAVGVARAMVYYDHKGIAITSHGESATSEGYVYEAINGASNEQLPVIFVLQDNGYGISVPKKDQTANRKVADNFSGFKNLRIIHCNGKDVFDSMNAMTEAREHAINTHNPVIVHANCVRIGSHSNSDKQTLYRDENELAYVKAADPLQKFRRMLLRYNRLTEEELKLAVAAARKRGEKVVMTNGVFDILHRGHVTYLAQAASLGASLVVAVNSDESVRMLGKGPDRPINSENDRAAVLAALESTACVVIFKDKVPLEVVKKVRPDIYVKGGDYEISQLPEAEIVHSYGGKVVTVAFDYDRSTTKLLNKVRSK